MSMYDIVFNRNDGGIDVLMRLLDLFSNPEYKTWDDVPDDGVLPNFPVGRLRDAWLVSDDKHEKPVVIQVYTRNGGGNRECWCDDPSSGCDDTCLARIIEKMVAHPWYYRDADDEFDFTYASFFFAVPESANVPMFETMLASCREGMGPVDTGKRWNDALDAMQ